MLKKQGPDVFSPYMLKYFCKELYLPLTILFTHVCWSVKILLSWKVLCITPVYKQRGDAADPHFYCTIGLLPALAMESFVHNYTIAFFLIFHLLSFILLKALELRTVVLQWHSLLFKH